uniref:Uncharacterized protein n=1 Tax=Arcella intermedia TaxID=1963864 RepID=A0A6B2LA99_9EUKA
MKLKRWYDQVNVEEIFENNKWAVTLDDRLIVTRNEKPLFVPTKQMALAVASEWEDIDGLVPLAVLPLTSLLARSHDDMPKFRNYYQDEILDFLQNDHVCFRDEDVQRDYEKQLEVHQPIVECFTKQTGLELGISHGCSSQDHPKKTIDTIHLFLKTLDDFTFHLFHSTIHATKSVATAVALWANAITIEHAISAVSLEEDLNANEHGFVEGAHDLKRAQTVVDVHCAALLLQLSGVPAPNQQTLSLLGDATKELEKLSQNEIEREARLNAMMLQQFKQALNSEIARDPENKKALQFFINTLEQKQEDSQPPKPKDQ